MTHSSNRWPVYCTIVYPWSTQMSYADGDYDIQGMLMNLGNIVTSSELAT